MATAVLLDIDGVLTTSWQPLPGAVETIAWLQAEEIDFRLLTNSSSRTRREIAGLLGDAGIAVDVARILTAVTGAARFLHERHRGKRCLVLNEGDLAEDLEGICVSDAASAEVALLGGAGPSLGYTDFDAVFKLALLGVPVVALHRNLRYRTTAGLALDMGAFVGGLEAAAGVEIPVVGKPTAAFFHAALADLGVLPSQTVVVGDDVEADVLGAQAVGATGVLVKTGKFQPSDLAAGEPDHVIEDIAQLPGLFERITGRHS